MPRQRHPIAERRAALGLSQEALAEAVGVDRISIGRWENGKTEPMPHYRKPLAAALDLTLIDLAELLAAGRNNNRPTATDLAAAWQHDGQLLESPAAVLDRMQRAGVGTITDDYVDGLTIFVEDVAQRYETEGPAKLAAELVRQRLRVAEVLATSRPSRRALRLMTVAGKMSAQLSYMAVNLGQFSASDAYAREAFGLADEAEDDELKAWVRGTQSFRAYYVKDYKQAAEYATDGLRYAGDGAQAIRLAINGEARAFAKLGNVAGADASMRHAFTLLDRFDPEPGMSSCISFGLYSEARVAANAATALLSMSRTRDALAHAVRVREVVDRSNSTWSKALVRLDEAGAHMQAERPELERVVELVREARTLSRGHSVESIRQRAETCLQSLEPWRAVSAVALLLDEPSDELESRGN